MFYAQSYLLSNFLGCFIMAVCINYMKDISTISLPLYKALTTGLCGCITTFASWMNDAINILFDHGWYEMLLMILFEFWLTWSAFTLGYATAKLKVELESLPINKLLKLFFPCFYIGVKDESTAKSNEVTNPVSTPAATPPVDEEEHDEEAADVLASATSGNSSSTGRFRSQTQLSATNARDTVVKKKRSLKFAEDGDRFSMVRASNLGSYDARSSFMPLEEEITFHALSQRISVWREDGPAQLDAQQLSTLSVTRASILQTHRPFGGASSAPQPSTDKPSVAMTTLSESSRGKSSTASPAANPSTIAAPPVSTPAAPAPAPPAAVVTYPKGSRMYYIKLFQAYEWYVWCVLFWCIAIPIWLSLIDLQRSTYYHDIKRRDTFRSVALAPLGAWLRWGLTRFPKLKAQWPEMNPQTLAANMIAVTFGCFLTVLCTSSWVTAINDGNSPSSSVLL